MTPKQTAFYWREWAKVRKADPAADRHELHRRALGRDKSSKGFTNRDLDKVLAEFKAISQPANVTAQVQQLAQPKKRLIWAIAVRQCQLLGALVADPDAYIAGVCQDKFGTRWLDDLSAEAGQSLGGRLANADYSELEMLRNTLARCISRLRQRRGWTVAELEAQAAGAAVPAVEPSQEEIECPF